MHQVVKLSLVLTLLLTACSPAAPVSTSNPTGAGTTAEQPAADQTLQIGVTSLLPSLSPEAGEVFRWGFLHMYDTVVTMDANYKVLPWAAEKWEQPNPTTWRMTIRKDMTFSNGDKLTAEDVEFTGKFMLETRTAPISQFAGLADVKLVDEYTVDFITKGPDPSVLSGLAYLLVMPKDYFNQVGRQGFAAKPIGSGPYELNDYRSGDVYGFALRSTPHPFRKPKAKEVIYRNIPQVSGILAGLKSGEIDISLATISADQAQELRSAGFQIYNTSTDNTHIFFPWTEMNDRKSPLLDRKVRLALNYAVDKDAMNKQLYHGDATVVGHLAPPGSPAWDPNIKPIPYDPARAKQLLAEAGYPNGFKFTAGLDYGAQNADPPFLAIQGYLRDIGVELPLNKVEYGIFIDKFIGKQPKGDLFWSSLRDSNGFNALERSYYGCTNPQGSGIWWCNEEFDRLNAQAAAEADITKRTELLRQASKAIADDVPAIFQYTVPIYSASSAKVRDFPTEAPLFRIFDDVYKVE